MNRSLRTLPLLALLLAVLLPLEQAHCMWMSVTPAAAASCDVARPAAHACCMPKAQGAANSSAGSHGAAKPAVPECPCVQLPPATTPHPVVAPAVPAGLVLALAPGTAEPVPSPSVRTAPRVDTGPAPPLRAARAHGLRAPPLPA